MTEQELVDLSEGDVILEKNRQRRYVVSRNTVPGRRDAVIWIYPDPHDHTEPIWRYDAPRWKKLDKEEQK